MACYMDEEEIYKCPTHPSKRRRTGICPTCLRERLNTLCPNCANTRPCECCPPTTSSFSIFSSVPSGDTEPTMRKSRSLAIPFLRSRSKYAPNLEFTAEKPPLPTAAPMNKNIVPSVAESGGSSRSKTTSLLSMFKKSKKVGEEVEKEEESNKKSNEFMLMMKRSRSLSVALSSRAGESKAAKTRGWHFPRPFRNSSKTAKVLGEHQASAIKV
ncbi:uncharacterized protein LOC141672955 [Apium graveolens]|uniref:uncharacterized protein LOC141672955 n=1 Tax=Apium graveolens TaxID=4045 RepID=UPI003D78E971